MNLATQAETTAATLDMRPRDSGDLPIKEVEPEDLDMLRTTNALRAKMANRVKVPVLPGGVMHQHINVPLLIKLAPACQYTCPVGAPASFPMDPVVLMTNSKVSET
jgi:hypothetical protein